MKSTGYTKKLQKIEILLMNDDFVNDLHEFKERWEIPLNGLGMDDNNQNWLSDLIVKSEKMTNCKSSDLPFNKYKFEIEELRKKYGLDSRYSMYFEHYVLYNQMDVFGPVASVKINKKVSDEGDASIVIEIFEDTTIKDIQKAWPLILGMKKSLFNNERVRFRKKTKTKRDQRIHELRRKGLSYLEIAETVNKEFAKEKALGYNEIAQIIRRAK